MRGFGSPIALVAGLALVLAVNAAILGTAWRDRRGGPRGTIVLTERELALPLFRDRDDSRVALRLVPGDRAPALVGWLRSLRGERAPAYAYPWLDRERLRSLGFDVGLDPADPAAEERYARVAARPAFVAYEFDGDAWRRWMAEQEATAGVDAAAGPLLDLARTMRSRLVPVDAATDAADLERRYADTRRYLILPAVLGVGVTPAGDGPPALRGFIARTLIDDIQVPMTLRARLESFLPRQTHAEFLAGARAQATAGWPDPAPPRYSATIAYGDRHEPWLVDITPAP